MKTLPPEPIPTALVNALRELDAALDELTASPAISTGRVICAWAVVKRLRQRMNEDGGVEQ